MTSTPPAEFSAGIYFLVRDNGGVECVTMQESRAEIHAAHHDGRHGRSTVAGCLIGQTAPAIVRENTPVAPKAAAPGPDPAQSLALRLRAQCRRTVARSLCHRKTDDEARLGMGDDSVCAAARLSRRGIDGRQAPVGEATALRVGQVRQAGTDTRCRFHPKPRAPRGAEQSDCSWMSHSTSCFQCPSARGQFLARLR